MARMSHQARNGGTWLAGVLAAAIMLAGPTLAYAQDEQDGTSGAERLMGEGLAKMLEALDLLLKTVPQYAAPEVQPNGDIIIRRLHPEKDEAPEVPETEVGPGDSTET